MLLKKKLEKRNKEWQDLEDYVLGVHEALKAH